MDDEQWLTGQFERHRPHLRAVAYRMLGSLADADDAVQDTWLRLSRSDADDVGNVGGWLTTIVARVCLNMLRSRNHRREEPLGVHVPDPVISPDGRSQPEEEALLSDSVGLALLVVLDTLTPDERLAFVLHDMFELPFTQIGPIVGRTPAAAKQLASRARRRVKGAEIPADPDLDRQREVVGAFFAAAREGDFDALLGVLHPDVLVRVDGGARNAEASMLLRGASAVAKQAASGIKTLLGGPATRLRPVLVNGSAGVLVVVAAQPITVMSFTVASGKITEIDAIADPERVAAMTAHIRELDEQAELEHCVQDVGEHQVEQPEPGGDVKGAERLLAEIAQPAYVGGNAGKEIGYVDRGQPAEQDADSLISGLEEHDDAQYRDERERDGHSDIDAWIGLAQPIPADGEPVHPVGGERQRRHVERRRGERAEQGQPEEQVDAGDELHEPRHPDAPHAGREVNPRVPFRVAEQFLGAVDQVSGAQPHEPHRQGRERGGRQADSGLKQGQVHHGLLAARTSW
jgi:RNA polymerase sigma factor (sigma-70 family)